MTDVSSLFEAQTQNRWRISQSTASERIEKLQRLKRAIQSHEADLKAALYSDFKKPAIEVQVTELFPVMSEIAMVCQNLKKWMKPRRVSTPISLLGTRSEIRMEARGVALIISPWNYPFMLTMNPLIAAVAAGNCAIVKPSEKTPATSRLMKKICEEAFPANEVAVVEGAAETSQALLKLPFDHMFFTGSTAIGQIVMKAATEHLSTVTLELGGKSPAILLDDANFTDSLDKLSWGKCINAGQTCIAPDYLFAPQSRREEVLSTLKTLFSERPKPQDMARIIDLKAFTRLKSLFDESQARRESVIVGGKFDEKDLYISPTAVEVTTDSPWMREEIFGPILPVIFYTDLDQALAFIRKRPKPLALYVFGQKDREKILNQTTAGGSVINNVVLHLANHELPFGGVGASGQGNYHGYNGFRTFSHERAVLVQGALGLSKLLFPPYDRQLVRWTLDFLKLISK